jgi:hypothetical protein
MSTPTPPTPPQPHAWLANLETIIKDLLPLIEQAIPIIPSMTSGLTAKDVTGKGNAAFLAKLRQQQQDHGAHSQLVHGWEKAAETQRPAVALFVAEMSALSGKSGETNALRLFQAVSFANAIQLHGHSDLQSVTIDQVLES